MIQINHPKNSSYGTTIELRSNLSMTLDRFFAVFLALSAVTLLVALWPLMLGLWPVMAVAAIHIVLVGWCFRAAWRGNWNRQIIHFGPETVTITHCAVNQNWSVEWPLAWLRLEQREDRFGQPRLVIRNKGHQREIGGFLPAEERLELVGVVRRMLVDRTAWCS